MEICGNLMGQCNGSGRDQTGTGNNTTLSWPTHLFDWPNTYPLYPPYTGDGVVPGDRHSQFPYGVHFQPDPHLTCLNLGKRHYFDDATALAGFSAVTKRGKPFYAADGPVTASVPTCQVEGCHVALVNVKEYHRRHRVCEMHSKAPKVVVLGLEQRFCQQCSRFHVVSEFDDSKRSCRRRLAGHNERRRKSSHDPIAPRNSSQGRALSLLSSKNECWATPSDLSQRSSAALRELIAENRAAILARQLVFDRDWHSNHQPPDDFSDVQPPLAFPMYSEQHQPCENGSENVTLNLMQARSTAFELLSVRARSKEEDEECSELWNSFQNSHVV